MRLIETITTKEVTTYTVSEGIKPGTSYWFKVRDVDLLGYQDSDTLLVTTSLIPGLPGEVISGSSPWAVFFLGVAILCAIIVIIAILMRRLRRQRPITWVCEVRYCRFCGEQITVDAKFCPKCGKAQE